MGSGGIALQQAGVTDLPAATFKVLSSSGNLHEGGIIRQTHKAFLLRSLLSGHAPEGY
jgi:hypothetical protein